MCEAVYLLIVIKYSFQDSDEQNTSRFFYKGYYEILCTACWFTHMQRFTQPECEQH